MFTGAHIVMALLEVNSLEVTGYLGGSAEIRCPYNRRYIRYPKYLCRRKCIWGSKDILVRTNENQTKAVNGRLFLHDDITAKIFTVTINELTAVDSGKYWCGIKTGGRQKDVYTELDKHILLILTTPVGPKMSKSMKSEFTYFTMYVLVCACTLCWHNICCR